MSVDEASSHVEPGPANTRNFRCALTVSGMLVIADELIACSCCLCFLLSTMLVLGPPKSTSVSRRIAARLSDSQNMWLQAADVCVRPDDEGAPRNHPLGAHSRAGKQRRAEGGSCY